MFLLCNVSPLDGSPFSPTGKGIFNKMCIMSINRKQLSKNKMEGAATVAGKPEHELIDPLTLLFMVPLKALRHAHLKQTVTSGGLSAFSAERRQPKSQRITPNGINWLQRKHR